MTVNVKTQPNSFVGLMAVEKVRTQFSQIYVSTYLAFSKLLIFDPGKSWKTIHVPIKIAIRL